MQPHSIFEDLFNTLWDKLVENYRPDETPQQSAARKQDFVTFYDSVVRVKGSIDASYNKKVWIMKHETGFIPMPTTKYEIQVRPHFYDKEKWEPLFVVKKSTLGMDGEGNITDNKLFLQSGFGLFAARDFKKGEYIGSYLGEVIPKTYDRHGNATFYHTSYSLDLGDDLIVDPGGGTWSHWYLGHHMMNDPRDDAKVNVEVDAKLQFFATRDIQAGEELFFSYGQAYWSEVRLN